MWYPSIEDAKQANKVSVEKFRASDILPPINGCGLLGLSWNNIFNP